MRLGHDVVILEGRDRVGGRSATTTIADTPVDLGGTFVGPTQDAVIALAKELGCQTVRTHSRGKNLIRWHGKVRSCSWWIRRSCRIRDLFPTEF